MSLFDGFIPTYTFRLQIERSDRTIIDSTIIAKANQDEIAKAKKNVQRLLNEYTPTINPLEPPTTPGIIIADEIGPAPTASTWEYLA